MKEKVKFRVTVEGDCMLSIADVWPNGDAPENPTAEDVVAAMRASSGWAGRLIDEWLLACRIAVDGVTAIEEK